MSRARQQRFYTVLVELLQRVLCQILFFPVTLIEWLAEPRQVSTLPKLRFDLALTPVSSLA